MLAKVALAIKVNGEARDLSRAIETDAKIEQASQDEIDRIVNQTDNFNADGSKKMNYLPIVIGGAVIIYLISRKK